MSHAEQREEVLFEAALKLPAGDRAAFLNQSCGADAKLRRRVEALLAAFERAGGFMNQPAASERQSLSQTPTEKPGDRIGRYKLLEQIGEGGCGVVYVADQEEPVRRRVALKVIKLGMDTKQVIARFDAERQALAMMDHPNIAKIHDAGATETGRPYFVMELVRGVKITDYCEQNGVSLRERLDLFIQVCRAIQHAHQKGIIHRDIKPSNILVTVNDGVAVPKVIDFGIAKATQGRLTNQTVYTAFEQFIGTPAYMSPEQAVMTSLDIDTRSDIYSLGVLLYELLTGTTPFDAKELLAKGLDEMRRTIREVEPVKPSTRLTQELLRTKGGKGEQETRSNEAALHSTLNHQLSTDLDWIVMKCLEKDRTRRYETANGLATDLLRHLNDEPIVARPPSKLYEFQKTVRRHRVGFAVAATIFILLAAGIALTTWQARRAMAALNELRSTAPAFAAEARALSAKERFHEAIEKLNYAIKLRPDVPEYRVAKGDLLQSQLKLAEAAVAYRDALHLKPGLERAEASAKLCDELIAASPGDGGKLTRESLAKLHIAMQQQQRPAAELIVVARLLGEEKELLLEYWLERLSELPVSAERPLKERLTVRDDGLLALDLSDTRIANLAPLAGMPLGALRLINCQQITNFAPLQDFRSLIELDLSNTRIAKLAPVSGLSLRELHLSGTKISDLQALRGMNLTILNLAYSRVADLSPLAGMPLAVLNATRIPASDYSPLTGAPLKECYIQNSPLRDLSFLRHSQVEQLSLIGSTSARGFAVLAGLRSLNVLILPTSYRTLPAEDLAALAAIRTLPALRNIDALERAGGSSIFRTAQTADKFWQVWDRERAVSEPLRAGGFGFDLSPLPDGKYRLAVENQPLIDLSFLKAAPVTELLISGTKVTDLRPLEQLTLTRLDIRNTPVKDLSPLRSPALAGSLRQLDLWRIPAMDFSPVAGCTNLVWFDAAETALADLEMIRGFKLRIALLGNTKVTNISALAGMPLERLTLSDTAISDLQPLLQCRRLKEVVLPRMATNVSGLRSLPRLERLSYEEVIGGSSKLSAKEFWLRHDHAAITVENVSVFSERSVRNPDDGLLAMKVAALQLWFGLNAEYADTCRRAIEIAERKNDSGTSERAAKNWCLQSTGDITMLPRVLALAREAAKTGDPTQRPWRLQTLGMAEFRAGNPDAAEDAFLRAEAGAQIGKWDDRLSPFVVGPSRFFRAMMLFQKGEVAEAKKLFYEAEKQMPPLPENAANVLPLDVDQDQLLFWLIHREAKAKLKLGTTTRP